MGTYPHLFQFLMEMYSRQMIKFSVDEGWPRAVGLYGAAAPRSVALFEGLCAGTLGQAVNSVVAFAANNHFISASKKISPAAH